MGLQRTRTTRAWTALGIAGALVLSACGGDDATDEPTDGATTPAGEATDEPTGGATAGATVTVTAVDYAYTDAPASIAAGTTVGIDNQSPGEVHEILAFRIDDDETRSVEELLQLPEEEALATSTFIGAALAPPGAPAVTPPLVLTDPGRYAFLCGIPTGAPPDEVMAAVGAFIAAGGEDPAGPAYPETGPPHFTSGMFAEVTVA